MAHETATIPTITCRMRQVSPVRIAGVGRPCRAIAMIDQPGGYERDLADRFNRTLAVYRCTRRRAGVCIFFGMERATARGAVAGLAFLSGLPRVLGLPGCRRGRNRPHAFGAALRWLPSGSRIIGGGFPRLSVLREDGSEAIEDGAISATLSGAPLRDSSPPWPSIVHGGAGSVIAAAVLPPLVSWWGIIATTTVTPASKRIGRPRRLHRADA